MSKVTNIVKLLQGLRMTNKDAARIARAAYGVDDVVDKVAKAALNKMNNKILNLKNISEYDIVNPPTSAQALKSGIAEKVARIGAENTAAFDRAIPDKVIGNFDWYTMAGMDAKGVGQSLGFRIPGRQRDVGAGIIARLSPMTQWDVNKKRAYQVALAHKSGELDRFLTFVDNNKLWGKSLNDIRELAKSAGLRPFTNISGIDTYQARDVSAIIKGQTGLASMKTGDLAKKIDDFYGAIRLSDPDRATLRKLGIMDQYTDEVLDPDYVYQGQRLGNPSVGPVIDKIQSGIGLGVPQVGYTGFELPLLDDPRTYRMQSNALRDIARSVGKTPLRMQSDPWSKRHYLYPDTSTYEEMLTSGGVHTTKQLTNNLNNLLKSLKSNNVQSSALATTAALPPTVQLLMDMARQRNTTDTDNQALDRMRYS